MNNSDHPFRIQMAHATDVGRLRPRNEDHVAANPGRGWALVADGMGGHRGGDVASAIVARELERRLDRLMDLPMEPAALASALREAVRETDREVFEHALRDLELQGMGSTVVVAAVAGRSLVVAHVGDSRAYLLRAGNIQRLTADHSLLQELLDGGMISAAEARRAPGRGILTRSLGSGGQVEVEAQVFGLEAGDRVLLCSDGLTDMIDDDGIARQMLQGGDDLPSIAARLIESANECGGRDNVSVVVISAVER